MSSKTTKNSVKRFFTHKRYLRKHTPWYFPL